MNFMRTKEDSVMKLNKSDRTIILNHIDNVISKLSEEERKDENPKKTCDNCYNLGATLMPLGWWARARCRHCESYSNWSHVLNLRKEIENAEKA